MSLRTLLGELLATVMYPLWLVAGAIDYFCHRSTQIEHTSGTRESRLHVVEFVTVGVFFACAVVLEITVWVLAIMILLVIAHSVFSFIDVSYTLGRRPISTLEQHVHGVLNVIPFVAVCLLAILNWDELHANAADPLRLKDDPLPPSQQTILLGSFLILAGAPVLEELFRTQRARNL